MKQKMCFLPQNPTKKIILQWKHVKTMYEYLKQINKDCFWIFRLGLTFTSDERPERHDCDLMKKTLWRSKLQLMNKFIKGINDCWVVLMNSWHQSRAKRVNIYKLNNSLLSNQSSTSSLRPYCPTHFILLFQPSGCCPRQPTWDWPTRRSESYWGICVSTAFGLKNMQPVLTVSQWHICCKGRGVWLHQCLVKLCPKSNKTNLF